MGAPYARKYATAPTHYIMGRWRSGLGEQNQQYNSHACLSPGITLDWSTRNPSAGLKFQEKEDHQLRHSSELITLFYNS